MSRPLKDRPDVRFFTEVALIDQLSRQRVERALPDGLSAASFSVLNRFARLGGTQSPAELAAAFQVTKGAMTNTLQRLEEQGLVKVEADPADGRRKQVTLTEAGARRLAWQHLAVAVAQVAANGDRIGEVDLAEVAARRLVVAGVAVGAAAPGRLGPGAHHDAARLDVLQGDRVRGVQEAVERQAPADVSHEE